MGTHSDACQGRNGMVNLEYIKRLYVVNRPSKYSDGKINIDKDRCD